MSRNIFNLLKKIIERPTTNLCNAMEKPQCQKIPWKAKVSQAQQGQGSQPPWEVLDHSNSFN